MEPTEGALPDPTTLSPQGRTDALTSALEGDDLLALVLVLQYAELAEVNGQSSSNGHTALQTAFSSPTSRPAVRSLAIQCLLHCGAVPPSSLWIYDAERTRLVREWESGGREQAVDAFQLVRVWTLEQVDAWIESKGFGVGGQPQESAVAGQPMVEEPADSLMLTAQQPAKEEQTVPAAKMRAADNPAQPEDAPANLEPTSNASPAPAPPAQVLPSPVPAPTAPSPPAHGVESSPKRAETSTDASRTESSPARPPTRIPSTSGPPRVLFTGLPKETTLSDVQKLVWIETKMYPQAHFTTTRQPGALDAVVELRNANELGLVLRRLNGVFLHNQKIGVQLFLPSSAEAAPVDPPKPEKPERRRSLSPRRGSPQHASRRQPSPSRRLASPRRESPPASSRRTRDPSDNLVWVHVSNLPRTVAERDLYDLLARARLAPEDVYVHHVIQQPFRFAFIAFTSVPAAEDAIVEIGSHTFNGKRPRVGFFRPRDGETQPFQGRHAEPRCRYAGPSRNRASPPVPNYRDLVVVGISPRSHERDLVDLIESKVGRGSIRSLQLEANSLAEDYRKAFVEMDKHSDASRALDRVDGLVFDRQALTVNWAYGSASSHREAAVDEQPARSSHSGSHRSFSPDRPPTSHARPPASPTQPFPSPLSPPANSASPAPNGVAKPSPSRQEDLDALQYLGMPPSDIEAISRMWTPLDEAPVSKSGKDFNRRIQAKVKFGFVPRQEAEAALRDQRMRMAFPDDPVMQQRFEVFLAAQAGHSKDWYLTFFAHIAEFNRLGASSARRLVATLRNSYSHLPLCLGSSVVPLVVVTRLRDSFSLVCVIPSPSLGV